MNNLEYKGLCIVPIFFLVINEQKWNCYLHIRSILCYIFLQKNCPIVYEGVSDKSCFIWKFLLDENHCYYPSYYLMIRIRAGTMLEALRVRRPLWQAGISWKPASLVQYPGVSSRSVPGAEGVEQRCKTLHSPTRKHPSILQTAHQSRPEASLA